MIEIVAEVKTQSPFGYRSEKSWEELFEQANLFGDIISIHTDPRWGGSFDLVKRAKTLTRKPILAKGIHVTDEHIETAIDAGADHVLVVGRKPDDWTLRGKCWIEPYSLRNLHEMNLSESVDVVVWNSRNLRTGGVKYEAFDSARNLFGGTLIQASGIVTIEDVSPRANGVLVGEHLEEFIQSFNNH